MGAGALGMLIGREYSFGTAGRMGPGYFPMVISALLLFFGAITVMRSFITPGEAVGAFAWKPLVLVVGSVVAFGLLINTAGLLIALLMMVLVSAAASEKFRFEWSAMLGLIGLTAFCSLVFVRGLGVPMPIVGSWLQPLVPAWLGG